MSILVLIQKFYSSCDCWQNLIRKKKIIELTAEEIVNKYKGFEGELISIYPIKEVEMRLKEVVDECLEIKKFENCLLLYVSSSSEVMPNPLKNQVYFMGYDVGVCEEEKTIYSSIFNEILFGIIDELIAYKDFLNENLLFQDKSLAESYVKLHNELSVQGKDVEDYEEMVIYEIWKHKD